ncbi:MAG: hypothetical protein RLZZ459_1843 [Cyanobacteriota bacterium]|jgi:ferredoxin
MNGNTKRVCIHWAGGQSSDAAVGSDWLAAARAAGFAIPTGCLGGSCGACEIDVNGTTVRACIATVPASRSGALTVELSCDPSW